MPLAESFSSNDDGDATAEKCISLDKKWFFHTTCFACNIMGCSSRPDIKHPRSNSTSTSGGGARSRKKTSDSQESEDSFQVEENWLYYSPADSHANTTAAAAAARMRASGGGGGGSDCLGSASPSRYSRGTASASISSMESGATEDGFAAEGEDLHLEGLDDGYDDDGGGGGGDGKAGAALFRGAAHGSVGARQAHNSGGGAPKRGKGKGLLADLFYVDGKLLCAAHAGARNALIHSACGDNPAAASESASTSVFMGAAPDEIYTGPVEIPFSNRESARGHCWRTPTPPSQGSEHPISVLSGWQPATFYLC